MKRFNKLFICLATLLAAACSAQDGNRAEKIVAQIHNPNSKYVVVVSHRGDWRNYPENSIPAIESVIRMGADVMELDLKMTSDSVLVLCHDNTVDRCTNGKGPVSSYTLDSIKTLRLRSAHGVVSDSLRMPTLEEALKVCKDKIVVNVDQGWEFYDQVLEITERLGVTDQILIKGKHSPASVKAKIESHDARMMYMPIIDIQRPKGEALFKQYMEAGDVPLAYELCFKVLDDNVKETCAQMIQSGAKLWINTLWSSINGGLDDDAALAASVRDGNPGAIYDRVLDLGASMIQTDRPEMLIKYLGSKGRRKL